MSMSPSRTHALGVDWTGPHPVLIEGFRSGRGFVFRPRLGPGPGPPGEAAALWAEVQFRQQQGRVTLSAALPVHCASILTVTAPFASRSKAGKVWPALLDLQLPFAVEDSVFAMVETHALPDGRTTARAVVARRDPVRIYLEKITGSGAPPNRLDFEGLALWSQSQLEMPPADHRESRVVASVSDTRTTIVVGIGPRFETAFSAQGGLLAEAETEAVRHRIVRSLRAAGLTSDRPLSWFWTGTETTSAGNLESVQRALESDLGSIRWRNHGEPDTFLARALARRTLKPDAWPCSLLSGDLTPRIEIDLSGRRIRRTARLGFAAAVALLLLNGLFTQDLTRKDEASRNALGTAAREVTGARQVPSKFELQTVRSFAERRLEERKPVDRLFQPPITDTLRNLLHAAKEESIRLTRVELSPERAEVSGWAGQAVTGIPLREALEKAGYHSTSGPGVEWKDGRSTLRHVMERRP
jgi:hypothetical protein